MLSPDSDARVAPAAPAGAYQVWSPTIPSASTPNGNFYGTTALGGAHGAGTIKPRNHLSQKRVILRTTILRAQVGNVLGGQQQTVRILGGNGATGLGIAPLP